MRRLAALILLVAMLLGCAAAEESAYDLALLLADVFEQMSDVRDVPVEKLDNRAVWKDSRADSRCALIVYPNEADAREAELADATRDTAVRVAGDCVLYLDTDMGADAILDYQLALAEILGVNVIEAEPDYILNVNAKKFHYPECYSVEDMKETNKLYYTGSRKDAIAHGYVPCKRCDP